MVLTIAGSDSAGGAGIQADLATFGAFGIHGTAAVTAVTAQSARGISGIHKVPPDFVAEQVRRVCGDLDVLAVKTGMLCDAPTVAAVALVLRACRIGNLVVDPVLSSTSGTRLLSPEGMATMVAELFPLALVITPNLAEAEALVGGPVGDAVQMREAARRLHGLGPRWVLVKGGHLPGRPVDVLFGGTDFIELDGGRIDSSNVHGTGCVLSAAIAAHLALGRPVPEAVARAKHHVAGAIAGGKDLGGEAGCVDPAWNLRGCGTG